MAGSPYRCGSPAVRLTDVTAPFALPVWQSGGSPYRCGSPSVRLTDVTARFALPMWQSGGSPYRCDSPVRLTDVAARFALQMWQPGSPYRCGSPVRITGVAARFALPMWQPGSHYRCGSPVRLTDVAGRFALPVLQSASPYRCGNPVADFFSHSADCLTVPAQPPRAIACIDIRVRVLSESPTLAVIPLSKLRDMQHTRAQPLKTESGCPNGRRIEKALHAQFHSHKWMRRTRNLSILMEACV